MGAAPVPSAQAKIFLAPPTSALDGGPSKSRMVLPVGAPRLVNAADPPSGNGPRSVIAVVFAAFGGVGMTTALVQVGYVPVADARGDDAALGALKLT